MTNSGISEVAQTIIDQLGRQARVMMGIKHILYSDAAIHFAIGSGSPKKVTKIVIAYEAGSDTYTLRFYAGKGIKIRMLTEVDGVYADGMHRVLESETGFRTSLGTMRG